MKKLMFFFISLATFLSAHAQENRLTETVERHNRRLDSIQTELTDFLIEKLHSVPTDTARYLADVLNEYENLWDYHFMQETETFRKELFTAAGLWQEDQSFNFYEKFKAIKTTAPSKNSADTSDTAPQRMHYSELRLHAGWNNFPNKTTIDYDTWRSRYVAFDWFYHWGLDKKNRADFYLGAGIMWSYLVPFDRNLYHTTDENGKMLLTYYNYSLEKSKIRTAWLKIPGGFQYNLNESWSIGAGAYAKVYISSMQKLVYSEDTKTVIIKDKRYFGQNRFIYGMEAYVSVEDIRFIFGMDFVPYYVDYDLPMFHFGISL